MFYWLATQVGYAICHQMPERTLHYGGRALPLCARDTGLFIGFALSFVALLAVYGRHGGRRPGRRVTFALVALMLPMVVDAVTSYAGWRETTNFTRLLTGALAGAAGAALLYPLAGQLAFGDKATGVVLGHMHSVLILLTVPLSVSVVMAAGWPAAFYPVWAALLVLSTMFTLLVLNFTLVSLIAERIQRGSSSPLPWAFAAIALGVVAFELVASNRLHWLMDSIL